MSQDEINAALVEHGAAGRRVVRLKGGDPFVFGRGGEEAQALAAAGVPYVVVPGITSAIAAPAYAGMPVTHRGVATSFTVVTGHEDPTKPSEQTDWAALARVPGTLVMLMGMGRLAGIAEALVAGGRPADEPAAAVQWGTTSRQRSRGGHPRHASPDRAREEGLGSPAVVVVGPVAALADEIGWRERRPCSGRTRGGHAGPRPGQRAVRAGCASWARAWWSCPPSASSPLPDGPGSERRLRAPRRLRAGGADERQRGRRAVRADRRPRPRRAGAGARRDRGGHRPGDGRAARGARRPGRHRARALPRRGHARGARATGRMAGRARAGRARPRLAARAGGGPARPRRAG